MVNFNAAHCQDGQATIGTRTYRWTFHKYLGPTFLKADGEPVKIPPSETHPVWPHFEKWLAGFESKSNQEKSQ